MISKRNSLKILCYVNELSKNVDIIYIEYYRDDRSEGLHSESILKINSTNRDSIGVINNPYIMFILL